MSRDIRQFAPAATRNRDPILDVLGRHLPTHGLVLEVASGTGEHITHFAAAFGAGLEFQPSDPEPGARASIDAWVAELGLTNVRPAIALDAASAAWPIANAAAVLCINMIHIAPWSAAVGLVQGAARILSFLDVPSVAHQQPARGGLLYLYGPFRRDGRHTSPGNASFDQQLRQQNEAWGIRDLEMVAELAAAAGFAAPSIEAMPANNLSLIFRRIESLRGMRFIAPATAGVRGA